MEKYKTMTEIGVILGGRTRNEVGKALKKLGLREIDGTPTEEAMALGLTVEVPSGGPFQQFNWDVEHVVPLLKQHFARPTA